MVTTKIIYYKLLFEEKMWTWLRFYWTTLIIFNTKTRTIKTYMILQMERTFYLCCRPMTNLLENNQKKNLILKKWIMKKTKKNNLKKPILNLKFRIEKWITKSFSMKNNIKRKNKNKNRISMAIKIKKTKKKYIINKI